MSYEDRIRQGLKKAGLHGNAWIELLALNMIPDHRDISSKLGIWKFLCPKWLTIIIITGKQHQRKRGCILLDFGQPGFVDVTGFNGKSWTVPIDKITGLQFHYSGVPDPFYKANPR